MLLLPFDPDRIDQHSVECGRVPDDQIQIAVDRSAETLADLLPAGRGRQLRVALALVAPLVGADADRAVRPFRHVFDPGGQFIFGARTS